MRHLWNGSASGHWLNEKRKKKEAVKAAERQREFDEELAAERQALDDDLLDIQIAEIAFSERQRLNRQLDGEMKQFKEQLKSPAVDCGITPVPEGMTPAQHQPELAGKPAEVSKGDEWGKEYARARVERHQRIIQKAARAGQRQGERDRVSSVSLDQAPRKGFAPYRKQARQ